MHTLAVGTHHTNISILRLYTSQCLPDAHTDCGAEHEPFDRTTNHHLSKVTGQTLQGLPAAALLHAKSTHTDLRSYTCENLSDTMLSYNENDILYT